MSRKCPRCEKSIPDHAPQSLCPACLLVQPGTDTGDVEAPTVAADANPARGAMLHGQFEPGEVLLERYRIVSLLGKGGMGEVYRADDLVLKEPVALKMLPPHLAEHGGVLEALRNEVKKARLVSHRHVCRVHDIGEVGGRPLLSMEFIEGEDLASLLRRIGHLPQPKAVQLAIQLAEGLEAAHDQDVLHLDLKPANLMINRKGDIKVSDFGLARLSSAEKDDGRIAGTPAYMAPEQAMGDELSNRSDIYSFGLILYEMLTGRRPFPARELDDVLAFHESGSKIGESAGQLADLPPALQRVIADCLAADAAERPDSFRAVLDSLRAGAPAAVPGTGEAGVEESTIEDSDVYLSFAPVDDQPISAERKGWITQFRRNLEIRVEQLSGRQLHVFRPQRHSGADDLDTATLECLPRVKAMVSVVSPPFANSPGCLREVDTYWETNARDGSLYVDGHTRVLKVMKSPVEADELPAPLRDRLQELIGFDFFEYDPVSQRIKEYAEWYGSEAERRFHERIYDLAQEINALFKAMGKSGAPNPNGKTVYLATTSSDITPLRDRIRRELLGRGHRVLPERPLPVLAGEAESVILNCLAESDLSIHPFGASHGVVPEGSEKSLAAMQNDLASAYSKETGLPRVIWIPGDVVAADERQAQLLEDLKTNPACHLNAEIVINSFQTLKPIVLEKLSLEQPAPAAAPEPGAATSRPRRIYLICEPKDEEAIEPLEDYLFEQGFELSLPDFEADEAEAAKRHRDNLHDCDAVIIFYGSGRNAWVDVKLRNILKMSGYGREEELAFNAVYVAPPFDRRKERYRSHSAEIIRQEGEFEPGLLQPLIARLRQD